MIGDQWRIFLIQPLEEIKDVYRCLARMKKKIHIQTHGSFLGRFEDVLKVWENISQDLEAILKNLRKS